MVNTQELHDARLADIKATCNHKEPKIVPILANVLTWAIGYANANTNEMLDHPEKLPETFTKFFNDVYFDTNFVNGLTTPVRAIERLGSNSFFVSEDGHTIQHQEHCEMKEDDYPQLIADPMNFMINILGKRKFPELRKSPEEAYKALIDVALNLDAFGAANAKCAQLAKEKYGIINLLGGFKVYPPVDVIFDRLRGFKGTLTDMRRQKENVIKAGEALYPIYGKLATYVNGDFPYGPSTLHCPTYLGPKKFEEIFWPGMRDEIMEVYNRGSKTLLVMEGTWEPYYEIMLRDLPQSSVLCALEADDVIKAKKLIGDKFTIVGGVLTNTLRYGTRQECLDEAKKIVDECAPGGGFIFSMEKCLCTYGDIKTENLIAVNQFVHEYGKY